MMKIKPTSYEMCAPCEMDEREHYPTVYLNGMPKQFVEGVEAGAEVAVVLYGKVVEVSMREREGGDDNCCSIDLEIHRADIADETKKSEWEELLEAD